MIAIDDQNDWTGCLDGHPQIQTPNIDALAERGTVFLSAHCQAPLCNPSRTSLMTGLRPSTTGIYGLAPWFRNVDSLTDLVTLPQYFHQHGWKTLSAGKIYHGRNGRKGGTTEFDVWGPPIGVGARPEQKLVTTPNPHPLVDWGGFPHGDEDKGDYKVASWAVEKLGKQHDKPFFLSAGFFLSHVPRYATERWFDLYPKDTLQLPPFLHDDRNDTPRFSWYLHWQLPKPRHDFLVQAEQWKNLVRSYLACTSFVDNQVGRILQELQDSPYSDNTIVIRWSDHGWHMGEKRITGKNTLWDRSTRVPLIFAGPGVAEQGRCSEPAELLDIYPTLAELCELPVPTHLEGHSLVRQLQDATSERIWPAITTHNHGVRSRDWRFIQYADRSEELYNIQSDPNEWNNVAAEPRMAKVLSQHRSWIPQSQPPAPESRHHVLTRSSKGDVIWEGTAIGSQDPIPELSP